METKFTEIMDMMLGVERIIKQMLIEIMVTKYFTHKFTEVDGQEIILFWGFFYHPLSIYGVKKFFFIKYNNKYF